MKEAATNTSLFLLTQLPCPNVVYTFILLGLYYGLLTTFPVGPSQILFLRSFLLGGNLSGFVSLSGLLLAQLITILSIYWSPIYLLVSRPHALTLASIPYTVFFCLLLKDFPNYHIFRPTLSLRDLRLTRLFLLTFLFQILNPIMWPNPVLIRLIYLNLFRYSTNKTFLIASFIGWLLGQVTFSYLSRLLLSRVEKDSPVLYLLAKRSIYLTFSIVFISQGVTCLGRAPISFWTKKFLNEADDVEMNFWDIGEYPDLFWWVFKPWPTSFFDPARTNRSNRFVKNNRFDNNNSFYRARTSTYFFGESLTDGKKRLSFVALPSLSIFERWVYRSMTKSFRSTRIHLQQQDWVSKKLLRTDNLQKDLMIRLKQLDTRSMFSKMMIKRIRLTSKRKRRIPRSYDPLVSKYRIRIPVPQTFLSVNELSMFTWEWPEFQSNRKLINKKVEGSGLINTFRDWIYAKKRKSRQVNDNPLPWEPLPSRSQRIFQFLFKKRVSYDYEIQNILEKIRSSSPTNVTWEEILNLEYDDQILFLIYLQNGCYYQFGWTFPTTAFSLTNLKRLSKLKNKIRRLQKAEDLTMGLARTIALYFANEIDIPGVDGDFRHRKLRNMGGTPAKMTTNSVLGAVRFVKRYARVSDFRRRLFKGSMRSRRRKTLLWKPFQDKIRSPFFLRSLEKSIVSIEPRSKANIKERFNDIKKHADFGSEKQLLNNIPITLPQERVLMNELKLIRSAVAARSDIGSIHNGRGYLLIFQSKFRKFIKIPVLIVLKSLGRIFFRQSSEWKKDWSNWRKEVHINCTFDGEEFSQDELPPRWLREGIQIKIIYPFHLKPWHKDKNRKQNNLLQKCLIKINLKNKKKSKPRKPKFTYLTVLGYQTDLPFGTLQKETSFWKPVRRKLIRICKKSLSRRFKHVFPILDSWFNWEKVSNANPSTSNQIHNISKIRQNKETPFDYDSTQKNWMISPTPAGKCLNNNNLGQAIDKALEDSRSIAIGGEMHSVNLIEKEIVSSYRLEKVIRKLGRDDFVTGSAAFPYKVTETNELDLNITLPNLVPDNPMLTDVNIIYLQKPDSNQPVEIKEALLSLYFFCHGFFERFILIIIDIYHIIDKISNYYLNEFLAFYIQLQRTLHDINYKKNLLGINLLLQLQKPSQASLYAELWDSGLMGDLNLDMVISNDKSIDRYKIKNQCDNACNNANSTSNCHQPKAYVKDNFVHSNTGIEIANCRSSLTKNNYEKTKKTTNQFMSRNVITCVERWGFLDRFKNFSENNWNEWLNYLQRYKLSLSMWYSISPQKWKVHLSKLRSTRNTSKSQSFPGQSYNYSLYRTKGFFKHRINNFIRLRKSRNMLQALSDFVQNGDIINSSVQQAVIEQKFHRKIQLQISSKGRRRRNKRFFNFQNPDVKGAYKLQFNLISWLDLNVTRTKIFFFKKETKDLLLKDNDQYDLVFDISSKYQKVVNELYEIMLDEREEADFIFRWKWKFELEFEKINNLIALVKTLAEEHDLITLCLNTEVDSDLLNFYFSTFETTDKLNLFYTLSIVSSHRLSLIYDDQDLLFKILQPNLRLHPISKIRMIKRLNKKVYNTKYISNISNLLNNLKHKKYCIYTIDDLLLPRRRWEFRFLRCLLLWDNPDIGFSPSPNIFLKTEQTCTYKKSYLHYVPGPIGIQKIKRFLWPSSRLEEVACISRFCLGITNGNQFAALRIRMYPPDWSWKELLQ
uniref:Protein TIC 214 n=1 Tax=Vittaria graminifolia TaxID=38648 RepID=A0A3G5CUB3_9MONI|nr:hypothetical protein [Vittaria graminifolia]AYW16469.1 hypothetical protein [Vittaria graminifolia]